MMKAMIVFALLAAVSPAYGDSKNDPHTFNTEFGFSAGGKIFPMGQYKIMHEENSPWVLVTAKSGAVTKLKVITVLARDSESTPSRLVFDKVGTDLVLSEVWCRGQNGLLVYGAKKVHEHEIVKEQP
jgi:hypothetical protein